MHDILTNSRTAPHALHPMIAAKEYLLPSTSDPPIPCEVAQQCGLDTADTQNIAGSFLRLVVCYCSTLLVLHLSLESPVQLQPVVGQFS